MLAKYDHEMCEHLDYSWSFVETEGLQTKDTNRPTDLAIVKPPNRVECAFSLRAQPLRVHQRWW